MNTARSLVLSLLLTLAALALTTGTALAAGPEAPEALKPEPIKPTEATLQGVINPKITAETEPGTYQFLYKATKVDTTAECESAGASKVPASPGMYFGLGPEPVSEPVTGLTEGTEYIVCLAVANGKSETTTGPPYPFKTGLELEAPVNAKVKAGSITATTAEVEGELNPGKERKTDQGYVEYLYKVSPLSEPPTGECEESVFEENGVHYQSTSGAKEEKVSGKLTDLQPNAKYTFCVRVGNEDGETTVGSAVHFTTPPAPPTIESESASPVPPSEANPHPSAAHEVRLEGVVNPNNQPTECHFQYQLEEELTAPTTVPCEPASFPASFGGQGVALNVGGLEEGKTYYYRVVAKNAAGETLGTQAEPIKHFETALAPSTPEQAKPTEITAKTATLNGLLNPTAERAKEPGTYEFVYRQSESECRYVLSPEEAASIEAEIEEARVLKDTEKVLEKRAELKADRAKEAENKSTSQEPGSLAQGQAVEAGVTGLLPGFTYNYCLVVRNEAGEEVVGPAEVFTTLPEAPRIASESVSGVEPEEATLNAQIDPNGGEAPEYHFEYLTEAKFKANGKTFTGAQSTPVTKLEGSLTAADPATAKITPLEPATTYHYQVVATNVVGGKTETTYGEDKTLTTPTTPSSEPSQGCENEARRAEQPFGQTLPDCRAYEMVSPVQSDGQDATDSVIGTVPRAAVSGEALAYASRGAFGAPLGANAENELISRREANGWGTQNITPLFNPVATVPGGAYQAMVFTPDLGEGLAGSSASLLKEAPTPGAGEHDLYLASFASGEYRYIGQTEDPMGASTDLSRVVFGETGDVSEWHNGAATVPVGINNEHEPLSGSVGDAARLDENGYRRAKDVWHAVSGDGSRVYFTSPGFDDTPFGSSAPGTRQLFVRVNVGGPQSPLGGPEASGTGTLKAGSTEVSSLVTAAGYIDSGRIAAGASELTVAPFVGQFRVGQPLSGSAFALGTTITRVSVAGNGVVTIGLSNQTVESLSGEAEVSSVGPVPFVVGEKVSGNGVAPGTTVEAIAPGSLTLSQPAVSSGAGVELRAGGECTVPTDACTVEVSASQRRLPNPAGSQSARYWGASADGSRTFFTSNAELTEDAYTGTSAENSAANLYEYDLQTGGLTDLTGEQTDNTGAGAAVQGVVQISEAGQYVYFVAKGALKGAGGATLHNGIGEAPVEEAEKYNLYVVHEGGAPAFVATLAANDHFDWASSEPDRTGPQLTTAVVSPGGGYLAFMSERSLTGYDNRQAQPGDCQGKEIPEAEASGTESCREVFLYDATTGATACASCDPTGARPVGPAGLRTQFGVAFAGYRPRNLLDDGALFFNSSDALVPHASDGQRNVYEFERGGVYPISNVTGGHESFFLDSATGPHGEEGANVFFATADQLLPEDVGNNIVVYDARAGGGFPVHVNPAACTTAEACSAGAPQTNPDPSIYAPPASATFSGPGNLSPAPPPAVVKPKPKSKTVKCAKGLAKKKVKKKQACVKKKSKKAKKSSKSKRGGKS